MREHFKGIVWPHKPKHAEVKGQKEKKTVYRYVVIGMLVTDVPLKEYEGKNEVVVSGTTIGMACALNIPKHRPPKHKLADANSVLTKLNEI